MVSIDCGDMLCLRSITEADTENVLRWRNSKVVVPFFNYQGIITPEDHSRWLREKVETGKVYQFILYHKLLSKDIGSVYIQNIDPNNQKGEFGIFIGEEDGLCKGAGTIATKAMIRFAFSDLKLHRLYLQVHADNIRAIKCYEKAGFQREAFLRDDVYVNGHFCDLVIMGILNKEIMM